MRPNFIENAWFADGWQGWSIELIDVAGIIQTVDGLKSGLITDRASPYAFPTVGKSYMLLAREISDAGGSGGTSAVILRSDRSYNFKEGDVITCDFGAVHELPAPPISYFDVRIGVDIDGGGTTHWLDHSETRNDGFPENVAARVDADATGRLIIRAEQAVNGGGQGACSWVSVDNIRWFSALDYLGGSDYLDTSGII